jgi:diazepam-binding inhibitor (GABA receptor modulator, acyl-CoA-binding protein)
MSAQGREAAAATRQPAKGGPRHQGRGLPPSDRRLAVDDNASTSSLSSLKWTWDFTWTSLLSYTVFLVTAATFIVNTRSYLQAAPSEGGATSASLNEPNNGDCHNQGGGGGGSSKQTLVWNVLKRSYRVMQNSATERLQSAKNVVRSAFSSGNSLSSNAKHANTNNGSTTNGHLHHNDSDLTTGWDSVSPGLQKAFKEAAQQVRDMNLLDVTPGASDEGEQQALWLYSLYKQATEGDASRWPPVTPSWVAQAKHSAWRHWAGMPSTIAAMQYIAAVQTLVHLREEEDKELDEEDRRITGAKSEEYMTEHAQLEEQMQVNKLPMGVAIVQVQPDNKSGQAGHTDGTKEQGSSPSKTGAASPTNRSTSSSPAVSYNVMAPAVSRPMVENGDNFTTTENGTKSDSQLDKDTAAGVTENGTNGRANSTETVSEEPLEQQMMKAASDDDVAALERLVDRGVNIRYQDDSGQSALHLCADRNSLEALKYLLSVDTAKYGAGSTAATTTGNKSASASQNDAKKSHTNGHSTTSKPNAKSMVHLIDHDGISVLQAAVIAGHVPMVCYLLYEAGADPDQADADGDTPRSCAEDDGSAEMQGLFDAFPSAIGSSTSGTSGDSSDTPRSISHANEQEDDVSGIMDQSSSIDENEGEQDMEGFDGVEQSAQADVVNVETGTVDTAPAASEIDELALLADKQGQPIGDSLDEEDRVGVDETREKRKDISSTAWEV